MDEIVAQAMARWPDVPSVYGWLRLDRRGRWLVKGEPIGHRLTVDFIGRNYHCDAQGRHFFQNGPQRVFVDIDHFPHVLWLDGNTSSHANLVSHAGTLVSRARRAWVDPAEGVIVEFDWTGSATPALGSVLDRDLPALVGCFIGADGHPLDADGWERLLQGRAPGSRLAVGDALLPVELLPSAQGPCPSTPGGLMPFVRAPRPVAGEDACT